MQGNPTVKAIFACTLFTTAVVAEIVRGGLNGIPKGQFDGAASQGFSFWQTLNYIVLPQTFKSIIPALLSQVITIIKDTSFLKAVDIAEFMRNSTVVMGQLRTPTQIITLYGFCLLYTSRVSPAQTGQMPGSQSWPAKRTSGSPDAPLFLDPTDPVTAPPSKE